MQLNKWGQTELTRTRYDKTVLTASPTKFVAYGWRFDVIGRVEYLPNLMLSLRSSLAITSERVEDSPVYGGKRSMFPTECANVLRVAIAAFFLIRAPTSK